MSLVAKFGQTTAVLGCQWGDEGKGKLVDIMSAEYDIIARGNGGANAGHTVYVKDPEGGEVKKFVFHLLPSGILHPGKKCVIGNGCVVHIPTMLEEFEMLQKSGIKAEDRVFISDRVHLLFDYHKLIDGLQEEKKGGKKVGTTMRGIGPCYADKVARFGIRAGELLDFPKFADHFRDNVKLLRELYGEFDYSVEQEIEKYREYAKFLQPMIINAMYFFEKNLREGKNVLLEGANGLLLDIDHGTYPYVTSSNPSTGGLFTGTGIPYSALKSVIGIVKAYTTRVGAGPFPTELKDALGDEIREAGGEYGATTGRPRRCGWFDTVVTKYSAMINGLSSVNLTKLDVLSDLEKIKVGVKYRLNGKEVHEMPSTLAELEKMEVEYIEMDGWQADISEIRKFEDLPENCQKYVLKLENLLEIPIEFIGVGKERDQMISRF